jgi:2-polyprenyl-3-methyl-5-hydroxy-6-metoxy-1,4-benzoquinol methylase
MTYSASYFATRERWRDWKIEARELIHRARIERGARVLEIGCGGGGLLRMLNERGAFAVGVDTLDTALHLAKQRFDAETRRNSDTQRLSASPRLGVTASFIRIAQDNRLPFSAHTFDALVAQHVIEHIADVDAVLREWARVLKRGGSLALATPNARYPDPAHFADADHARLFTPRELRDAVARAGWRVEECTTIFPYLTRARFLRGVGVVAYRAFMRLPSFAERGRTIVMSARL